MLKPIHENMEQQMRFISDASHELRTPLTAIQMENEVALRDKNINKKELHVLVKSNLEETQKLQKLTNQLLELSQNEALMMSEINLKETVDSSIKRISKSLTTKKIKVKNNFPSTKLLSNENALSEIVFILLENAVKYSPTNSTITIEYKNNRLSISDEGKGIAEKDLPHIFDRFYRGEKSRTSDGYGLGLSLAQNLACKINAKVIAQNNKKHGTKFIVLF
jgi:signal transduction histidine kinase